MWNGQEDWRAPCRVCSSGGMDTREGQQQRQKRTHDTGEHRQEDRASELRMGEKAGEPRAVNQARKHKCQRCRQWQQKQQGHRQRRKVAHQPVP
jgi:hypothetical protein